MFKGVVMGSRAEHWLLHFTWFALLLKYDICGPEELNRIRRYILHLTVATSCKKSNNSLYPTNHRVKCTSHFRLHGRTRYIFCPTTLIRLRIGRLLVAPILRCTLGLCLVWNERLCVLAKWISVLLDSTKYVLLWHWPLRRHHSVKITGSSMNSLTCISGGGREKRQRI